MLIAICYNVRRKLRINNHKFKYVNEPMIKNSPEFEAYIKEVKANDNDAKDRA